MTPKKQKYTHYRIQTLLTTFDQLKYNKNGCVTHTSPAPDARS